MNSATASAPLAATAGEQEWLTIILRPAGSLDHAAVRRLGAALGHLAAGSDMVIVDLTAAVVYSPHELALALREPAREFERAGRCLLVLGASPALSAELERAAVPVATLAADAQPKQTPAPLPAPRPGAGAVTL